MSSPTSKSKLSRYISDPNKLTQIKAKVANIYSSQYIDIKAHEPSIEEIVEIEEDRKTLALPSIMDFNHQYLISNTTKFLELYPEGTSNYMVQCESARLPPRSNGLISLSSPAKGMNVKYIPQQPLLHR
jgi:hypothetical protein